MILNAKRRGYALLWVILFTSVLAALAAATVPYLVSIGDTKRVTDAVADLRAVGQGIISFQASVGHFPSKTSQLSNRLSTTQRNSCWTGGGSTMTTTDSTNWSNNGPYAQPLFVAVGGIYTSIGRLRDSIPSRTSKAAMFMEMPGVTYSDAQRFKAAVDSNAAVPGDTVTILHLPVAGNPDTTTIRMRLFVANAFSSC